MTTLIDLRQARRGASASDDLAGLRGCLAQLVGEPFRFARVSYGDELTLHFGDLRPAKSAKLPKHLYGAYVLGVRGSTWLLKSGSERIMLSTASDGDSLADLSGAPIRKEELEADPRIRADSRVLAAIPFAVSPTHGFGLQLRFSDGSGLVVLPTASETDDPTEGMEPELADWELLSPSGLLDAGPGPMWSFRPSEIA